MLVNGPVVNYALLNSLYPAGSLQRNTGDVFLDSPNRSQPYTQQISAGYQRQLGPALSASADYVHTDGARSMAAGKPEPRASRQHDCVGRDQSRRSDLRDQRLAAAEYRRVHLRRAQRGAGKARLPQLERPRLLHAGQFTRQQQRGADRDEQLPGVGQSESRSRARDRPTSTAATTWCSAAASPKCLARTG